MYELVVSQLMYYFKYGTQKQLDDREKLIAMLKYTLCPTMYYLNYKNEKMPHPKTVRRWRLAFLREKLNLS